MKDISAKEQREIFKNLKKILKVILKIQKTNKKYI